MTTFEAALLGFVQGLTEFLPVSSSGHLVVVPELLGIPAPPLAFDVLLHLSSALAVMGYFAREIGQMVRAYVAPHSMRPAEVRGWRRLLVFLVVGSIPAGVAGLVFGSFFEHLFSSTLAVGLFLMVTGLLMLVADAVVARSVGSRRTGKDMKIADALVVGLFQALAIAPGLSRSGSTICAGVFLGFERKSAARFSFLLSIPVILGAGLANIGDLRDGFGGQGGAFLVGAAVSFVASALAVYGMLRFLRSHRFRPFVIYTLLLGAFVVVLSLA